MEVTAQGMPYSDWKDNEYIEHLVKELKDNGVNVVVGTFDKLINWGRSNSPFVAPSGRLHDGGRNYRPPHGACGKTSLRPACRT